MYILYSSSVLDILGCTEYSGSVVCTGLSESVTNNKKRGSL